MAGGRRAAIVRHQHLSREMLARQIRSRICRTCIWRLGGSRHIHVGKPLLCETDCSIFLHLEELARYTEELDPMLESYAGVVNSVADNCCRAGMTTNVPPLAPTCNHGTCPLRRYAPELASILQALSHSL
jgi:hypothetical protein